MKMPLFRFIVVVWIKMYVIISIVYLVVNFESIVVVYL